MGQVPQAADAIDLITVTLWHLKLNLFPKKVEERERERGRKGKD